MEDLIRASELLVWWPVILFVALIYVVSTFKREIRNRIFPGAKSGPQTQEKFTSEGTFKAGMTA